MEPFVTALFECPTTMQGVLFSQYANPSHAGPLFASSFPALLLPSNHSAY